MRIIQLFFFAVCLTLSIPFVPAEEDDFFAGDKAPAAEAAENAAPTENTPAEPAAPEAEDDFFADDAEPAAPEAESAEADDAGAAPAKKESFLSGFLSRFENSDDGKSDYRTPVETVLPRGALMLAATSPISALSENVSLLLKGLGLGKLSPTDWIRLSPYGKAFRFVDQSRRLGIAWIGLDEKSAPTMVLYVPIRRFLPFAAGLGAEVASYESDGAAPAGTLFPLKKPAGWYAFQKNGYACLLKSDAEPPIENLLAAPAVGTSFFGGPGLVEPDLRLAVTPYGIRRLIELAASADSAIMEILPSILEQIRQSNPDFDLSIDDALPQVNNFADWVVDNLRQFLFEVKLTSDDLLTSAILVPESGTELAAQIQNRGGPDIPTLLDQPEFLKILPEQYAPISGQTDLFPEFASKLEPPFDRVRHIEYSIGVPREGQLLAEPLAFFLEVDDSDAFVHELLVPKARLVGGHIGAEKMSDVAGQVLGNMSLRRRAAGRRPLFFTTPEEAAEVGAGLGELIGKQIGSRVGEDQALKKYEFEGFPLYVSDMKTYIEEMRKIRAEQTEGRQRKAPPLLSPRASFQTLLTTLLSGLETGSIDGLINGQIAARGGDPDDAPIPAVENLILVLDRSHVLIVPGDRDLLSAALARWRDFVDRRGASAGEVDSPWRARRDLLYGAMSGARTQILRSAALFDLSAARAEMKYLQKNYGIDLPPEVDRPVPADLAEPLFVGTNAPGAGLLYAVFPDEFLKFLLESRQNASREKK
ncbi:MAG: hypothetical protein K6E55_10060 [Thermoguttaceae bacterium]|nr:hypothetical protein [Thermoguttaceae bacterium]